MCLKKISEKLKDTYTIFRVQAGTKNQLSAEKRFPNFKDFTFGL